jgi:drug/metabolite transporter (DMT)-like permease
MLTYVKLFLTATFWGGTFIAGRIVAADVDPYSAAFFRFAIAAVFLAAFVWKAEGGLPRLQRHQILPVVLLGMTGVFAYNVFFFKGLQFIPAGRASLIIALNPIGISALSAVIFKERLNWLGCIGITLSVTGAVVVITDGQLNRIWEHGIGTGELLILGCVASWVSFSLIGKSVMTGMSPLAAVCYSAIIGAVALFLPALSNRMPVNMWHYTAADWASLFYLGFFGTVLGFFWYYQGIRRIGPAKASVFINFVPVSAIIMSYFILEEALTPSLFLGAVLVISGVCATNASRRPKKECAPAATTTRAHLK